MNKYKVINRLGSKLSVRADFYNTCASTGISTFYVDNGDGDVELVATYQYPVSVKKIKKEAE